MWAGEEIYRACSLANPPQCYWHAANSGAKTRSLVALDLAFLSGRSSLMAWDGTPIPIPVIQPPVAGGLIIPSYKVTAGSALEALRALLGDWAHHEGVVSGAQDAVGILYVKHRRNRSDDYRKWSRLYVFPHDGEVPEALRLDFVHADEPPPWRIWDAAANRAKAGRPFFRYIGATPIERRFWQWLRDYFPRPHRKIEAGRLRLQSSIYDNRALTPADIARAEETNANSPHRRARLFGEHVDISGSCPFDGERLHELLTRARDGVPHAALEALRDGASFMRLVRHERGQVEVWGEPAALDRVLVLADPSSGSRDPDKLDHEQETNPAGLIAVSIARRALLARFNGYVTPPELALLARALCNRYRSWIFVPEMNGGWGEECLRSFMASPRAPGSDGMVYQDVDPTSTIGNAATRVGWWQSANRVGATVAALQRAILEQSLELPSRDAIENLMSVRFDDKDRAVQGSGRGPHGEDMRLLGMACSIMENPALAVAGVPARELAAHEVFERALGVKLEREYDGYAPEEDVTWR